VYVLQFLATAAVTTASAAAEEPSLTPEVSINAPPLSPRPSATTTVEAGLPEAAHELPPGQNRPRRPRLGVFGDPGSARQLSKPRKAPRVRLPKRVRRQDPNGQRKACAVLQAVRGLLRAERAVRSQDAGAGAGRRRHAHRRGARGLVVRRLGALRLLVPLARVATARARAIKHSSPCKTFFCVSNRGGT